MSRGDAPSFREHDATLSVWLVSPNDSAVKQIRNGIVSHLRSRGFRVQLDARVKRLYRAISQDHHEGQRGALQFELGLHGRHVELKFFQNVVRSNPSGGQYDFDRRKKMPYLIGKAYEAERRAIARYMREWHGLELQLDNRQTRGQAFVERQRADLNAFQGGQFYAREWQSYNTKSATGRILQDGDAVFFRGFDKRLRSGIAYRNINCMWWVLLPSGDVTNIAVHELWHRDERPSELRGRFYTEKEIDTRMRCALAKAIEREHFERAARIRDAFRRRFPAATKTKAAA